MRILPVVGQELKLDLAAYDGVALRLKGDGQMYKINIKSEERGDNPESTYAATFETLDGECSRPVTAKICMLSLILFYCTVKVKAAVLVLKKWHYHRHSTEWQSMWHFPCRRLADCAHSVA